MSRTADPSAKIDLLSAAEAVFVECGLDQAKVEEIAARAGRSKGAFYLHFASKEEAFRQIVETLVARLARCLADGPITVDSGEPDQVRTFLARWLDKDVEVFEYVWQNRGVMRLLLEGGRSASFGWLMDEFAERARGMIAQGLEHGRRHGAFRADLDVELASLVIAGAYDRVARALVRAPKRPELRAWLAGVQQILVCGLLVPRTVAALGGAIADQRVSHAAAGSGEGAAVPAPRSLRAAPAPNKNKSRKRSA